MSRNVWYIGRVPLTTKWHAEEIGAMIRSRNHRISRMEAALRECSETYRMQNAEDVEELKTEFRRRCQLAFEALNPDAALPR